MSDVSNEHRSSESLNLRGGGAERAAAGDPQRRLRAQASGRIAQGRVQKRRRAAGDKSSLPLYICIV